MMSKTCREAVTLYFALYVISKCFMIRDHAANILFDDVGEDQPIPLYILEALLKV